MHLSYQEVPLNGTILLTGDALSPPRDLQSAAAAAGQKEEKKKKERKPEDEMLWCESWEYSGSESLVE